MTSWFSSIGLLKFAKLQPLNSNLKTQEDFHVELNLANWWCRISYVCKRLAAVQSVLA